MTSMCLVHTSGEKINLEINNLTVVAMDIIKRQKTPHVHKMDGHQNHCVLVCSAVLKFLHITLNISLCCFFFFV